MLNIEPEHPIYRPLWVRVLLVAVLIGWSALEFYSQAPFWGVIAGGVGLFAAYELMWRYPEHRARADAKIAQAEAEKAARQD